MILLDTHAVIWAAQGNSRMGPKAQTLVNEASVAKGLFISPISAWEVAMLVEKRRLTFTPPVQTLIAALFSQPGVRLAGVTPEIAVAAGGLKGLHGDPADRFLIATAQVLDLPLLTVDRLILDYAAAGHLQAIDAAL